jgi:D-alanyl-D-alanine carboxypeptidase
MGRLAAVLGVVMLLAAPAEAASRYASIVIDADTGKVLHEAYADHRKYPASLAKMMTLYLLFDALDKGKLTLDKRLAVSRRAEGMSPSKLGLRRGSSIKVRDVILALVTKSANDAAVVAAEALAGTEIDFALVMTAKAKQLGMRHTEFRNASGLPNRYQKSTARDMATLARALIRDFPKHYHFFSATKFSYGKRTYSNHNALLRSYQGTDGIKTGYIRASGFNLVASAERGGRRLIVVVFGGKSSRSRDAHAADLLNRGFTRLAQAVPSPPGPPRRNPFQLAAQPATTTPVVATPAVTTAPAKMASSSSPAPAKSTAPVAAQSTIARPTTTQVTVAQPTVAQVMAPEAASRFQPTAALQRAWGVQVGAFSRFQPAHSATETAQLHLPEILVLTKTVIRQVNANGNQLYRAQLIGLTELRAREACRMLKSKQQSCIVVPPQQPQSAITDAG